jgi:hypothetical protein
MFTREKTFLSLANLEAGALLARLSKEVLGKAAEFMDHADPSPGGFKFEKPPYCGSGWWFGT